MFKFRYQTKIKVMKISIISLLLIIIPVILNAQSDSVISERHNSSSEILNHWYNNSYQPKSTNKSILKADNASYVLKMNSYKKDMNFLYVHSYRYHYFPQMPYSNGPVSNFYSQTGNWNYGGNLSLESYFLASGINYIVDKAIWGRKRR